jgi:hypothetical protein
MHHSAQESASRERDTILLLASEKVTMCKRWNLPSDGLNRKLFAGQKSLGHDR